MKKNKKFLLNLNLIPATSWGKNARSEISKKEGDRIRKQIYRKANYTCEICGVKNQRLDCNELGEYKENKQILVGLEAVCRKCHLAQHIGYASVIGKEKESFQHLIKVNNGTQSQGEKYVKEKFKEGEERSKREGELDLSYLNIKFEKGTSPT